MDFKNLNWCSLNDNIPLSKMDHLLQKVIGASIISMMARFLGYNKIAMHMDDKDKTASKRPWGTFVRPLYY